MDVEKIREDFPILKRKVNGKPLVYFDNGATTQKPRQVLDAVRDYYENHNGNAGRGVHTLAQEATDILEGARKRVAKFINAKPEEIIFTQNTTYALVMAAWGLADRLKTQDRILNTVMDHHSTILPCRAVAKRTGAKTDLIDITDEGLLDYKDMAEKAEGAKFISAVHTSNVLGTINDARRMSKIAHDAGALLILDGAQSAPHMPIDVKKLGCDFFAFSSHKMLGPMGIGVLWGRKELLEEMEPVFVGGGTISKVTKDETVFREAPAKFEPGTPNIANAAGMAAAIDYLDNIGLDEIHKHEQKLIKRALDGMGGLESVSILGTEDPRLRTGLVSFNVKGMDHNDVALVMDEQGIALRSGQHCCGPLFEKLGLEGSARASFYLYNTEEEVDKFLEVLRKLA